MTASVGNINAIKNGSRMKGIITRLNLNKPPTELRRPVMNGQKYRSDLEAAVVATRGEVNLIDAHLIDEAASHEIHINIMWWMLRTRFDKLSDSDLITCSREITKAKERRNRAVSKLGLDKEQQDLIEALYTTEIPRDSHAIAQEDPPVCNVLRSTGNATDAKSRIDGTDHHEDYEDDEDE